MSAGATGELSTQQTCAFVHVPLFGLMQQKEGHPLVPQPTPPWPQPAQTPGRQGIAGARVAASAAHREVAAAVSAHAPMKHSGLEGVALAQAQLFSMSAAVAPFGLAVFDEQHPRQLLGRSKKVPETPPGTVRSEKTPSAFVMPQKDPVLGPPPPLLCDAPSTDTNAKEPSRC